MAGLSPFCTELLQKEARLCANQETELKGTREDVIERLEQSGS